ncbi:MAG: glycosyltransferase family 4 protein [Solobacterium sp.]|nr:glycosyltransferase family 4 protein [Solobacterium sp.]
MIAVDFTFLDTIEYEQKTLLKSFCIFTGILLDAFADRGMAHQFRICCTSGQKNYLQERFPDYEVAAVNRILRLSAPLIGAERSLRWFRRLNRRTALFFRTQALRDVDCIWFPYGLPEFFWKAALGRKYVLTIHDLMIYHNDVKEPADVAEFRTMMDRAAAIAGVSEMTREDIKASFPDTDPVYIPNPFLIPARTEADPGRVPYILCINGYGEHKNQMTLLNAYARIAGQTSCRLVFCGGWSDPAYVDRLKEAIRENHLEERVDLIIRAKEEEVNDLLKNCTLFVSSSRAEGFGRTPIEAALYGKSVIVPEIHPFTDTTHGLVHCYKDPMDDRELADCILDVLEHPDAQDKLMNIRDAFEQEYSAAHCAEQYAALFRKVTE